MNTIVEQDDGEACVDLDKDDATGKYRLFIASGLDISSINLDRDEMIRLRDALTEAIGKDESKD